MLYQVNVVVGFQWEGESSIFIGEFELVQEAVTCAKSVDTTQYAEDSDWSYVTVTLTGWQD